MAGEMKRIVFICLGLMAFWALPAFAQSELGKAQEEKPDVNKALELKKKIKFFQKEIELNPKDPSVYYDAGVFYWGLEQQGKAMRLFNQAVDLQPRNAALLFDVGLFYGNHGQINRAQKYFSNALRIEPKNTEMILRIGLLYGEQDQMERAEKYFRRVLQLSPQSETYLQIGRVHMKHGYFDRGIRYMDAALKLDPDNPGLNKDIGKAYLENGFFDKAVFHCGRALEILKADADAYMEIGLAFWDSEFEEYQAKGLDYLERTIKMFPGDSKLQFDIGTELMDRDAPDAASRFLGRAIRIQPANAELYFKVGSAYINYLELEEISLVTGLTQYRERTSVEEDEIFKKGLEHLEKAIGLDPDQPGWHWSIALLFDAEGMGLDAIYHLIVARELFIMEERYQGKVQEGNSEEVRGVLGRYYEKYGYIAEDFNVPDFKDRLF